MASILKPEGSLTLGAATAALVYGIYSFSLPDTATIHATDAHDVNVEAGRKKAAWTSVVAVAGIALMARDKTIFILGGATVFALDWHTRHANAVSPDTGQLVDNSGYVPAQYAEAGPVEPPIVGQAAGL